MANTNFWFKNICIGIVVLIIASLQVGCQDINKTYHSKPITWPIGEAYGYHWDNRMEEWSRLYKIRVFGDRDYVQKEKQILVNEELGIEDDLADAIVFPQRDGSFKPLGKHRFFYSDMVRDTSRYNADFKLEIENNELVLEVRPREEYSGRYWPTYTNCGYLTGRNEIAYVHHFWDQPKVYYGKYDLEIKKFIITHAEAPQRFIYRAHWDRDGWDISPGADDYKLKHKNEARGFVLIRGKIQIICNESEYKQAKNEYQTIMDSDFAKKEWESQLRLMPEVRKTLTREHCDGTGIRYPDNCKQLLENTFYKKLIPWTKWGNYTSKRQQETIVPEH